jgi:hypothetical protein
MFSDHLVILCATAITLPFFGFALVKSIRRFGPALTILSPGFAFYSAYLFAFAFRPLFTDSVGALRYSFVVHDPQSFLLAEGLAAIGCIAFLCIYSSIVFSPRWHPGTIRLLRFPQVSSALASSLSLFCSGAVLVLLARQGVFVFNIGETRRLYLDSMHGAGYVYLLNQAAMILLFLALVLPRTVSSLLCVCATTVFLALNIALSNRSLVTSVLLGLLLLYVARRLRKGAPVRFYAVALTVLSLVAIGVVLGMLRGHDLLNTGAIAPIVFLLWTFDMADTFSQTISVTESFAWGRSWLEDLLLTYLPRFAFPSKPDLYGAVQLQASVLPASVPPDGVFHATYPIGLFGEAYANFGAPGVVLTPVVLGFLVGRIFRATLRFCDRDRPGLLSVLALVQYAGIANALGYMRSFGWFLAGYVFNAVLFTTCVFVLILLEALLWGLAISKPGSRDRSTGDSPKNFYLRQ